MGRKRDMVRRRDDVGQRRINTGEETTPVGVKRILLGQKMKKISTMSIQQLQMDDEDLKQR
jgi:hypothetical protein